MVIRLSDEREVLVREFPVDLVEGGDGRTIEARIVPYNVPTRVSDHGGPSYVETWLPGAFDKQARAADKVKVWLNFEHEDGLRGIVGHGAELQSRQDALYGTFRVHNNADGDKALQMVHDGLLTGISLEAIAMRSRRTVAGVVERVRAHLDKVSLCRFPAFEDAQVLAVREAPEGEESEPEPSEEPPAEEAPAEEAPSDETPAEEAPAEEAAGAEESDVERALEVVGYEPLLKRAVTRRPWDGSPARFTDEQYQRSALLCRPGDAPPKERCSLPVLEPNGDVNANALGAAAARINQLTGASPDLKAQAARKLVRLYRMAGMDPPPNIVQMAAR